MSDARARFTALFERLAIEVLKATDIHGATRVLRISWDEAWHILERAVARGRRRKGRRVPARLGIDEKAAAKGHRTSGRVSRRWRWICGSPTCSRSAPTSRMPTRRSFSTGSKYLWLYAEERLPARHRERFAALKALHLKTGRAWAIQESLRALWAYVRRSWAQRHWQRWLFWATHSRLVPIIKAAKLIDRHLPIGISPTS